MYTGTPFSFAYAFISSSSPTVGAPGFSRYTCVQPAAITSLSRRGLSAVRPEISASVGPCVIGVTKPCVKKKERGPPMAGRKEEEDRGNAGGSMGIAGLLVTH